MCHTPDQATESVPEPEFGRFTSLLVADGDTRGLANHLARLDASARELFGKGLPGTFRDDLAAQLADLAGCR